MMDISKYIEYYHNLKLKCVQASTIVIGLFRWDFIRYSELQIFIIF